MVAILFEALLIEILEEIHHFAGWEGGLMGTKIVNKHFVNKLAFPIKLTKTKLSEKTSFPRRRETSIKIEHPKNL